jgi:hypothetical protein
MAMIQVLNLPLELSGALKGSFTGDAFCPLAGVNPVQAILTAAEELHADLRIQRRGDKAFRSQASDGSSASWVQQGVNLRFGAEAVKFATPAAHPAREVRLWLNPSRGTHTATL